MKNKPKKQKKSPPRKNGVNSGRRGGETPMLCVTMILSQSTKLHTSPVWTGA